MAPIFHYVLSRIIREQGARKSNRSEHNDCENVCEASLRRDPAVAETEVVAIAETEAQPPDPPQTDDIMELILINAWDGAYSWDEAYSWKGKAWRNDDDWKSTPQWKW